MRVDALLFDLRSSLRSLGRRRLLAVASVLCLALGIGVHLAAVSLADALLNRPPAGVEDPEELSRISVQLFLPGPGLVTSSVHSARFGEDLDGAEAFEGVTGWASRDMSLGRGQEATPVRGAIVSTNFFEVLGVDPPLGRSFLPEDGEVGAAPVVVVSQGLWRRALAADPAAVREGSLVVNGTPHRVVGVAPKGFAGLDVQGADLWLPPSVGDAHWGPEWRTHYDWKVTRLLGRRAPGVSPEQASAEVTRLYRAAYGHQADYQREAVAALGPLQEMAGPAAPLHVKVLRWMVPASFLVLLLACLDVAHLLLVSLLDRRRELAVRSALGAGRGRLVGGVVLEALLLAGAGGALGLLLAAWGRSAAAALLLPEGAVLPGSPFDLRSLGLAAAVTLTAGALAALLPAVAGRWKNLALVLASEGAGSGAGRSRLREGLLALQVALTLLVLAGSGLFLQSLAQARGADSGMDLDRVLVVDLGVGGERPDPVTLETLYREASGRIERLPGVSGVGSAIGTPLQTVFGTPISIPGIEEIPDAGGGGPYWNAVDPGFFEAPGMRVAAGRPFDETDSASGEPVAAINVTAARLLWPDGVAPERAALGRCVTLGDESEWAAGGEEGEAGATGAEPCRRIVAVVDDLRRFGLEEAPAVQVFVPLAQVPEVEQRALFVRAAPGADMATVGEEARRALNEASARLAPAASPARARPMVGFLDRDLQPFRIGASLLTLFGGLALVLATAGLVGATLHAFARRRRELAVRLALGAGLEDLLTLLVRQGLRPGLWGIALGLAAALAAGRLVEAALYEVSPLDPLALTAAAGLLALTVLAAALLPALRVRSVDPAASLREE